MEQKKVAVVTGATGGIGAAVARALSKAGYRVALGGRSEDRLAALALQFHGESACVGGDLRGPGAPARLLDTALEPFGRCDVCLNNAGTIEVGRIEQIDIERVCDMVRLNVEATFRVTYTFLKHFAVRDPGHLVNMSQAMGIPHPLAPEDVARMVMFVLEQPAHVRIPHLMILPADHEI